MGYSEILSMISDYKQRYIMLDFIGDSAYYYILGCIETLDALDLLTVSQVIDLNYLLKEAKKHWEDIS